MNEGKNEQKRQVKLVASFLDSDRDGDVWMWWVGYGGSQCHTASAEWATWPFKKGGCPAGLHIDRVTLPSYYG